ncbi:SAM-dependent methyltransferase [Streptomyces sp. NPDC087300]|uniref:SAM-dependent methyltransferase n=1 Tax=Streptomyces sp. NPDC087300 TaxID=3365780 RepID=UPI0037F9243E
MREQGFGADEMDTGTPHSARIYDYFLGGKDHYPPDRKAGEDIREIFPHVRETARSNRAFMHRASRYMALERIDQFLDIGTGIPTEPNLHQVVQEIIPSARVVYADRDPLVLRHARALLGGTPQGRTEYLHADLKKPREILAFAREHLDFQRPVALSIVSVLQFVSGPHDPYRIVDELVASLAPGSYLVLSHVTSDFEPAIWERIDAIYRRGPDSVRARSREEFAAFFHALDLCEPGITVSTQWHPVPGTETCREQIPLYVGVARKP